ncbi:MAG: GNAT family N-acetyltransferase [Candidatus Hodarchaeales archaeon]|jgi:L-amino acid N-acyltransferase YncA
MTLKNEDRTLILQLAVKQNLLPQFSFHLYLVIKKPTEVTMVSKEGTLLFQYENHLTTYGHLGTVQLLLAKHPSFEIGDRYEIYFPSHHLPAIQSRFEDFELIDEAGSGTFNNLICLSLDKSQFLPRRQAKNGKRLKSDSLAEFDPDLASKAEDGIVYGIIENGDLVSIAPVPYIIERPQLTYAIIQDIWTREDLRGQGYATGSVRSVLNFLFTRKAIKNVFCWVEERNEPAMKLFQRIGFQKASIQDWVGTYGFVKDMR